MKTKLLFSAALMAAMMASQGEARANAPMPNPMSVYATAEPLAEGEEVGEESDYTSCLRNALCSDNTPGWVRNSINKSAGYVVNNSNELGPGCNGVGVEFWVHQNPSDPNYGDVTNKDLLWQMATSRIPAGQYVISAYAAGRNQGSNQNSGELLFFAGDATTPVTSITFQAVQVTTTVGLEPLKLGLRGGTDNQNNWVAISQIQVKLQNTLASLQAAIGVAEGMAEGDETLAAAIAEAKAVTGGTPAEFNAAILALNEAMDECLNRQLANVTESTPKDWTVCVDNIDFIGYRGDAFDVTGAHPGASYGGGVEIYRGNTTMARTLTNVPNGKYRVSLQARTDHQNGELVVFAQGAEEVTANVTQPTNDTDPDGGEGSVFQIQVNAMNARIDDPSTWTSVEVLVTNGSLTFGSRQQNSAWCVYNGFKVEYLGVDLSALETSFAALQEEASQYLAENPQIPQGCIDALNEYVTMSTEGFTANNYDEAITALTKLLADAPSLVAPYAAYSTLKTNVSTFNDETVASEEAEQAMANALSTADVAVEAAASVEELNAAVEALWSAVRTYAAAVTDLAEGVEQTDVTFMADNMDMSNTANRGNWYTTKTGWGNCGPMNPNPGDLGADVRFVESYVEPGNQAANVNTIIVGQDLTQMPKGAYQFAAMTFNRRENFGADAGAEPVNPVRLYVNGFSKEVSSQQLESHSIIGKVGEDGALSFGIKAPSNLTTSWHGIADAHLYYLGAGEDVVCDVVLDENSPYVELEDAQANVTLYRALSAENWNTFCVPFDMSVDALAEVKELTSAEVVDGSATLTFSDATSVEAGKAYLVKAVTEAANPMTFEDVTVKAGQPAAEPVNGVTLVGNYTPGNVPVNNYFISDNAFYLADVESVVLKGFRAYITVDGATPAVLNINVNNGGVTGIEDVEAAGADKLVNVVTLDGVTVKAGVKKSEALDGLQKGIYIVDGEKYAVK